MSSAVAPRDEVQCRRRCACCWRSRRWRGTSRTPRYWAKVDALLAAGQFSTEQAVLTQMAAEAADGFELVPTENYRYIARKMLNCP